MGKLGLQMGLQRFRIAANVNQIGIDIIAALNNLTNTTGTVGGDLTETEIGTYADTINGEII